MAQAVAGLLLNIVTLTSLFPGSETSRHGIFVQERMRNFQRQTGDEVRVVAPVPYFPRIIPSQKYGHFARTPLHEQWGGFEVHHPRYFMMPVVGVPAQGMFYSMGVKKTVRRLHSQGLLDVLDVHYAYPDGFAGALLKHRLKVPMVLTVRGTDVNLLPRLRSTRSQVRFALRSADHVVAVSQALADLAVEAGADPSRVTVLRNGVNCERFSPEDRDQSRKALGLDPGDVVLVSVGFLVERKGHELLIRALSLIPEADRPHLLIVGDGPEEERLRSLIRELGLSDRVQLLGPKQHEELPSIYSAANMSVLVSSREGMPNVVLESLACGVPVIATDVHGTPELITGPSLGTLVPERTVEAIATAIRGSLAKDYDRDHIRRYAEGLGWEETSFGLRDIFRKVREGAS